MRKAQDFVNAEFRQKMVDALKSNEPENVAKVFVDMATDMQKDIILDIQAMKSSNDVAVLAARGVRQLTDEEKKFYKAFQTAASTGDVEKAFEGIENAYPETVIEAVAQGIRESFPLLEEIDFQVSKTVTKMILNAQSVQLAQWGEFGSEIKKKLDGKLKVIDIKAKKLAALMPVSMDIVEAGPEWVDNYVRKILVEAVGQAFCYAIIKGRGKTEPIGMMCDCSSSAAVVDGVYPIKEAVTISDLDAKTLGDLYARLCKDDNDRTRTVTNAMMVCNPIDYYRYIFPAITVLDAYGNYVTRTALPVKFILEASVDSGEAVFGIGKEYFLGVCFGGKTGRINFSDEAAFAEDARMYKNKLLADGRPKNNSSFLKLDLSDLIAAATDAAEADAEA